MSAKFGEPWKENSEVDSWVTEKFPTAIRIMREKPPFAFGEDIAAVHPSLPEVSQRIVSSVNALAGISDPEAFVAAVMELEAKSVAMMNHYIKLVDSGDAGFWDPNEEKPVVELKAAVARVEKEMGQSVLAANRKDK